MTATKEPTARGGVRGRLTRSPDSVMRDADFMKIWAGESVSLVGTQITIFALPLVAILTLHASVFQVGLLNMSRNLPLVVFSLLAGVWLDRMKRRPILIACSLANAALIGLVPLSSAMGWLSMGLLYAVTILVGIFSVFFDVGVLTYMPSLVGRRKLPQSNSMIQTSTSLAMVAGPGIAGALIGVLTAPVTLAADAISYVCSAIGLMTIRKREPEPEQPAQRQSIRRSIAEGLRSVYGSPVLRSLLGLSASFNFAQSAFITILVVYAVRSLGLSPFQLGIVIGATAVGGGIGAALANRVSKIFGVGPTMLCSLSGATLFPLLFLIPQDNGFFSVLLMSAIQFVYGFGVLIYNVHTVTLRQVVTPDRLLGRMNASYRLVLLGTQPPGAFLAGVVGQEFGLHTALLVAVIVFPFPILWSVFSPVMRMKEMPAGPDEEIAEIAASVDDALEPPAPDEPRTTNEDDATRDRVGLKDGQNQ
ncbi:MAG: MFS transporter [Actinoallomurus sp.]